MPFKNPIDIVKTKCVSSARIQLLSYVKCEPGTVQCSLVAGVLPFLFLFNPSFWFRNDVHDLS